MNRTRVSNKVISPRLPRNKGRTNLRLLAGAQLGGRVYPGYVISGHVIPGTWARGFYPARYCRHVSKGVLCRALLQSWWCTAHTASTQKRYNLRLAVHLIHINKRTTTPRIIPSTRTRT